MASKLGRLGILTAVAVSLVLPPAAAAAGTDATTLAAGEVEVDGPSCRGDGNVAFQWTYTYPLDAPLPNQTNTFVLDTSGPCTDYVIVAGDEDPEEPCQKHENGTIECHTVIEGDGNDSITGQGFRTEITVEIGPEGAFWATIDDDDIGLIEYEGTVERIDG